MTSLPKLSFDPSHPAIPLEGKPENFQLSEEERRKLALLPLEGKATPEPGEKKAVILWGPPGSGKTTQGHAWLAQHEDSDTFVTVCYDEKGALHSIAAYTEQSTPLVQQHDAALASESPTKYSDLKEIFDKRLELYRQSRDDSQRIRSYTLNEAVVQGKNIFIDITAAGKGAGYLMDNLKQKGYEIELVGRLASAEVANTRVNERGIKVVEPDEVFSKRVGCYESLPDLIKKSDRSSLYLNDVQNASPVQVIATENGQAFFKGQKAKDALMAIASKDVAYFSAHSDPTVRVQTEKLKSAIENMGTVLDSLPVIRNNLAKKNSQTPER